MNEEKNEPEEKKAIGNEQLANVNENISQQQIAEQLQISNPTSDISKSDIENMEVHHHPHVEKKNFKEYLLEGLMIFLAVTMGFFAESLRENVSNHEKELNYMKG